MVLLRGRAPIRLERAAPRRSGQWRSGSRTRAIVCDFDGTLVDSTPMKWRAFERCFADYPAQRREILDYCRSRHHTPRGEKFRYVYERILKLPYTPRVAAQLHTRFEAMTTRQIIGAPAIPGVEPFLRFVSSCRYPTAVLSSTPHAILTEIIASRGWQTHFQAVQGAPIRKAAWLRTFRERHGLSAESLLFIGDTTEDAESARKAGCSFIGIAGLDGLVEGGSAPPVAPDFQPLLETLRTVHRGVLVGHGLRGE